MSCPAKDPSADPAAARGHQTPAEAAAQGAPQDFRISNVRFVAAPPEDVERGLLGWVSLVLNDTIKLDGVTLRRTASGRLALSFPAHRDAWGQEHQYVRPLDDRVRKEIEHQVFCALGIEEVTSP